MFTELTHVTLLVDDQDQALEYYTQVLDFEVRDDLQMETGDRWVTVGIPGQDHPLLTLVNADGEMGNRVGTQAADHVFLVIQTDDCRETYETLTERGVSFHGEPEPVPWGVEVTFEDCYGNVFDLVEPRRPEG